MSYESEIFTDAKQSVYGYAEAGYKRYVNYLKKLKNLGIFLKNCEKFCYYASQKNYKSLKKNRNA